MNPRGPRCAVVFKTYAWDSFVERQAKRLQEAAGSLDFYVSIDETNGPVGPVPFERVIRFTCDDLTAEGLPPRSAVGGVLWWNPDYAHYQFQSQCPDYDSYLFVEYDCVAQCSLERLVARATARQADLVASPITKPFGTWHWMHYQRRVYRMSELRLALLNICFFSSAALLRLHQRRLAMGSDPSLSEWPSSELFVPTEVLRANMTWLPLSDFGDISHCDWFPPTLEEDLQPYSKDTFLHPVLDQRRYIASMLNNRGSLKSGELSRALARFPRQEYAKLIWPTARRNTVKRIQHKLLKLRQQVGW